MPETTHQPSGAYPKPTSVRRLDLEEETTKLTNRLPGRRRQSETVAREAGVSLVMMAMEGGDVLARHHADGVVTVHLLDGHVTFTAAGESFDLRPGEIMVLQPKVPHDVRAEEQSVILLTITGGAE